jgi:hypothetical protein
MNWLARILFAITWTRRQNIHKVAGTKIKSGNVDTVQQPDNTVNEKGGKPWDNELKT